MYKVFVGYGVPSDLHPAVQQIDNMVQQHNGTVERRKPLHVTVMAPRIVTNEEQVQLEKVVEDFNKARRFVLCRLGSLRRFVHRGHHHFVVEVKGRRVEDSIDRFHANLEQHFSWQRQKYEGRSPHITLLSSKIMDSVDTFDRVVRGMGQLELPTENIKLPSLVLHTKRAPRACTPQLPEVPLETGWHP